MSNVLKASAFKKSIVLLPLLMTFCQKKAADQPVSEVTATPLATTNTGQAAVGTNPPGSDSTSNTGQLSTESFNVIVKCDASLAENADWVKNNCDTVQGFRKDANFIQSLDKLQQDGGKFFEICTKSVDCSTIAKPSPSAQNSPTPRATIPPMTPEQVAKIASEAGFVYDPTEDIYVTRVDALQRYAGYREAIDAAAFPVGMVIDTEPIPFQYKGTTYMIELWKGQYYASTGAEIGIYKQKGIGWECAGDEDMLQMSYSLTKNGQTIFKRSGKHWWLTGFKPGVFSEPNELVLDNIQITFKDQAQRDGFLAGLHAAGYEDAADEITTHGNTLGFKFTNVKSKKPWTQKGVIAIAWQTTNKSSTKAYDIGKALVGRTDNSPETISLMVNKVGGTFNFVPNFLTSP